MYEVIKCNLCIKKLIWIVLSKLYICIPIALLGASIGYNYSKATASESYYITIGFYIYGTSNEKVKGFDNGSVLMSSDEIMLSNVITSSYIEAISSDIVGSCVKNNINTDCSSQEITNMINCYSVKGTSVIYAQVIGPTPKIVYEIANSLAHDIPDIVSKIVKIGSMVTFDYPKNQKVQRYVTSNTKKLFVLGGAVGFAISSFICLLLGIKDPTIRNKYELEAITNICVIAMLPYVKRNRCKKNDTEYRNNLLYGANMPPYALEAYSKLRIYINKLISSKSNCVIVITSYEKGCGKTTCAINIALSQCTIGRKVLLIDLNSNELGTKRIIEITEQEEKECKNRVFSYNDRLDIFVDNNSLEQADKVIVMRKVIDFITLVKKKYDCIIVNTQPIQSSGDAYLLQEVSDAYIPIVRVGQSSMIGQKEVQRKLDSDNELIYGYILNYTKRKKK